MLLKCVTCKAEVCDFNSHVKDVWHTYNLRRETVGLAAVSREAFVAKQAELVVVERPEERFFCCSKKYRSQKTYEDHLRSKKHSGRPTEGLGEALETEDEALDTEDEALDTEDEALDTEAEDEDTEDEALDTEAEDEDTEAEEGRQETPLTVADCLFCSHAAKDFPSNLAHMSRSHEFSFPYPEYLHDPEGLMAYLINLIDTYSVCLKCDKQFYDRLSVRNHMRDRTHQQINVDLDNNADILAEFYNSIPETLSTLNSALAEDQLPNGKMIGNRQFIKYIKQNLNGLSNTNHLSITSGMDKAKMSLIHVGRITKLAKPGLLSHEEKKLKSKEARYRQYRASRYSNFQAHYRHQILM